MIQIQRRRLRPEQDGGNEAALDGIHGQSETFESVGSQDLEVSPLSEDTHGMERPPVKRDEDLGGATLSGLSLNGQDAPPLGWLNP